MFIAGILSSKWKIVQLCNNQNIPFRGRLLLTKAQEPHRKVRCSNLPKKSATYACQNLGQNSFFSTKEKRYLQSKKNATCTCINLGIEQFLLEMAIHSKPWCMW